MKLCVRDLRSILTEARHGRMDTYLRVLEEEVNEPGDSQSHVEGASGTSLDEQVDRLLIQYEGDSKKSDGPSPGDPSVSQMESVEWRDLVRGVVTEAGEADKDSKDKDDEAPGADDLTGDDGSKLGLDHLDVAKFADDVVRLVENYDSLLEVRNTLVRRAREFLSKAYSDEVLKSFEDVLRDDHGIEAGKDKQSVDAERYPAPSAERASGSAEPGAGGGGAP